MFGSKCERRCAVAVGTGLLLLALAPLPAAAAPGGVAELTGGGVNLEWRPLVDNAGLELTVTGPAGFVLRRELAAGQNPALSLFTADGQALADGEYTWELRVTPQVDPQVRRRLQAARRSGDEGAIRALQAAAKLAEGGVQSGSFHVVEGAFVVPQAVPEPEGRGPRHVAGNSLRNVTAPDTVIPDDLVVQGSGCFGFDCVNNEDFGFDTIRLKENNLRIKFQDTSVGSYPTNDWQLTANSSDAGGQNKFSIDDVTGAKTPFTVEAGATTDSIYVDSSGKVGLRTATPVLDLHIKTSNTPGIRLEQTNAGGFTAQTWDLGGNEANFFVRDVTGGSRLPFRIRPGAPTSSIDISADGDVGIGVAGPSEDLHVSGSDGTTKVLVTETNTTAAARELLELRNNGGVAFILDDTSDPSRWTTTNFGSQYLINNQANTGVEVTIGATGNVTISGTLTQNSDRTTKTDIAPVDTREVLARVASLPISTWRKVGDAGTHLGPMAQDFAAAFGLGDSDRQVALIDLAGVSLAAIQALQAEVEEKDRQIVTLEQRLAVLEALVAGIARQ